MPALIPRFAGKHGGKATVASHGPQMANGGKHGGKATVASHGPQLAIGGKKASGKGCGKGGNLGANFKLTLERTQQLKEEGHEFRKCCTCGKEGIMGRQHWKAAADRAEGEARSVCGRYTH